MKEKKKILKFSTSAWAEYSSSLGEIDQTNSERRKQQKKSLYCKYIDIRDQKLSVAIKYEKEYKETKLASRKWKIKSEGKKQQNCSHHLKRCAYIKVYSSVRKFAIHHSRTHVRFVFIFIFFFEKKKKFSLRIEIVCLFSLSVLFPHCGALVRHWYAP